MANLWSRCPKEKGADDFLRNLSRFSVTSAEKVYPSRSLTPFADAVINYHNFKSIFCRVLDVSCVMKFLINAETLN